MRYLIVGCGYVGSCLARELLQQGHAVVGLRRSAEGMAQLAATGVEACIADVSQPGFRRPTGRFDGVVFTAAVGRAAGAEGYRAVYVDGLRHVLAEFAAEPPTRFVYTSSTAVYGQRDGSVVKETSHTEPATPTGRVLLEAEGVLLAAARKGFPAVVLRVAGIYGPERTHRLQQFAANEVRLPGQGQRLMNMVHRDDVVGAILAALKNGRPGEVYNVVDQEPVTEIHFYTWLAETLGKWLPPFGPAESDPARIQALTNRKISNRRLTMELGYRLKYLTFRQGYTAEVKRLTDAGLLDIEPENRG